MTFDDEPDDDDAGQESADEPLVDVPADEVDGAGGDVSSEDAAALASLDDQEAAALAAIRGEAPETDEEGRQRRQNVRIDVQVPMTLWADGQSVIGRTRDLSATGVGFSTRVPVELEQRLEVELELSGWRFRKPCTVRFLKPILAGVQVGVQFDDLEQQEREQLVKVVFEFQRAKLRRS